MANGKKLYDGNVISMVATVATDVRDIVVFGDSVGIALTSGATGEKISVDTVGVYEFDGATADEISVGTVLYWDATNKVVTTDADSGANIRAGVSWGVKASGVAGTVGVKIG